MKPKLFGTLINSLVQGWISTCREDKKTDMDIFLTTGIILGLSSGFSPGPLTTLVISQALQHGAREGLKVALAPFITDLPIVLVSVFVMTRLRDFHAILGLISIIGGIFLVYLAYLSFKTSKIGMDIRESEPRSLGKGTAANLLNPAPYLFWITIGAPNVVAAWTQSPLMAAGFLAGFYMCLVGAKMFLAVVAAKSRRFLSGPAYAYVMRILGVLLLILAFVFLRDGIRLWG
jgi:threonine/homoserine/homoserine lactone efflux protein